MFSSKKLRLPSTGIGWSTLTQQKQPIWLNVITGNSGINLPQCSLTSHNIESQSPKQKLQGPIKYIQQFTKQSALATLKNKCKGSHYQKQN